MPINDVFSDILNKNLKQYQQEPNLDDKDFYKTFNTDKSILTPIEYVNKINLPTPEELPEEYKKIGIVSSIYDTQEDYQKQYEEYQREEQRRKAKEQSFLEQLWNFAVQVVGSEIVLGTIKGIIDIGDAAVNLVTTGEFGDFSNPLSEAIEKGQEDIRSNFAIYEEDPNSTFNFGDPGWWLNRGTSVASSVTLLIPGLGAGKAATYGSKALRGIGSAAKLSNTGQKTTKVVNKIADKSKKLIKKSKKPSNTTTSLNSINNLSRTAKSSTIANAENRFRSNFMRGFNSQSRLAKAVDTGAKIGVGSLVSRTAEGYMEARDVWKDSYNIALQELNKPENAKAKDEFIKKHPEFKDYTDEELAEELANRAAEKTFKLDYTMLAFDMLQMRALNKILTGGIKNINQVSTVTTRLANKNILKQMVGKSASEYKKLGFMERQLDKIAHPNFKVLSAATEIPEEMFQGISSEIGKEEVYKTLNPDYDSKAIESYLSDPHIWEQGFWGFMGGSVVNALASGYNTIKTVNKAKKNNDDVSKRYNDYLLTGEEKFALTKIEARQAHFENLINSITKAEEDLKSNTIDETTFNLKKEDAVNQFLTDITLDAVDSGTYDLLKDFMTNSEFEELMKSNNIELTTEEKEFQKEIIKKTDNIKKNYANEVHKVLQSVDEINPYVAQIVARNTTRKKLRLEELNQKINNYNTIINAVSENDPNNDKINETNDQYYKTLYYQKLNDYKKQLEEEIKEIENNDELSVQHKEELIFDKKRILYNIDNEINTNTRLDNPIMVGTPYNDIKEKINEKINYQIEALNIKSELHITPEDYINEYEYLSGILTEETKARFDKAYDNVWDWLKEQKDIIESYNKILKNEIPELENDLDILKLGYGHTDLYKKQLILTANALIEERHNKNNGNNTNENPIKTEEQNAAEQSSDKAEKEAKIKSRLNSIKTKFKNIDKSIQKANKPSNEEINKNLNTIEKEINNLTDELSNDLNQEQINELNQYKEKLISLREKYPVKNKVELEKTDDTIDTSNPFTGEEVQINYNSNKIYEEEVEELIQPELDKQLAQDSKNEEENDELIEGSSFIYIQQLFNENRELFTNIKKIDYNSEEFKKLLEAIKQRMIDSAVYGSNIDDIITKDLKNYIYYLQKRIARGATKLDIKDQLDNIIKILSMGIKFNIENKLLTNAELIDDTDIKQLLKEFFDNFIKLRNIKNKINNKYVIDLNSVFDYLFNAEENYSYEEVYKIFNLLKENIDNLKDYEFINKNVLEDYKNNLDAFRNELQIARQKIEYEARYTHAEGTHMTKKEDVKEVMKNIKNGSILTCETTPESNNISIKYNGVEIAYLAKVKHNGHNNKYSIISTAPGTFKLEVELTEDGQLISNLDKLFDKLNNGGSEIAGKIIALNSNETIVTYDDIVDAINNKNSIEIQKFKLQNKQSKGIITTDEYNKQLNDLVQKEKNSIFILDNLYQLLSSAKLINDNLFLPYKSLHSINYNKTNDVLANVINNIFNYDSENRQLSYLNYLSKQFENYKQTYKIQENINKGIRTVKFVGSSYSDLIFGGEQKSINDRPYNFTHENNHLVVLKEDSFIDEVTGLIYKNKPNFGSGTFGLLLNQNPNAPLIALLQPNKVVNSPKINDAVKKELTSLFSNYQNETLDFDDLYNRLVHLFGLDKGKTKSNSLFNGLNVFKSDKYISIWKKDKNGNTTTIALIHKNKKNSEEKSTGITYYNNNKSYSTFKVNDKFLNQLTDNIINNLEFNKTFYSINIKGTDTSKNRSPYFYKEKGKIHINIGGENGFKAIYDNYTQFIFDTDAFTTNHKYIEHTTDNGIYIEITETSLPSPVKGELSIPSSDKTTLSTRDLFSELSDNFELFNELSGKTEETEGIDLIPETIEYDETNDKTNAFYDTKTKRIVITKEGVKSINKQLAKSTALVRLLMHEQLHKKIDEHNLFEQKNLVNELLNTYNKFLEHLETDKTSKAETLKNWLKTQHFTSINDYISELTGENVKNITENHKRRFAEEWLVESLSQPLLIDYLNTIEYDTVNVSDITNDKKTIWQKIIDLLLKIFGKSSENIKNNTILAKHYELLGKQINNNSNEIINENETNNTEIINENETNIDNEEIEYNYDELNYDNEDDIQDPDELYSNTNLIENNYTYEEDNNNTYYANTSMIEEPYTITDMNSYIRQFPLSERTAIARQINAGNLSFVCK